MPFWGWDEFKHPCKGQKLVDSESGTLNLPSDKIVIEEDEFNECDDLKYIVIPEGVTEIGKYAFHGCRNVESISLPSTLEKIDKSAFACCCSLKNLEIPEGIVTLEESSLAQCLHLKNVILPESLAHIKKNAFEGCYDLSNIVFKNCHLEIEACHHRGAFWNAQRSIKVFVPSDQKISSKFRYHFSSDAQFIPYEREIIEPTKAVIKESEIAEFFKK